MVADVLNCAYINHIKQTYIISISIELNYNWG